MYIEQACNGGHCIYLHVCRMILVGELVKHVARNKVEIFRFDLVYGLTYDETTKVSDHYPLGLVVQSK